MVLLIIYQLDYFILSSRLLHKATKYINAVNRFLSLNKTSLANRSMQIQQVSTTANMAVTAAKWLRLLLGLPV